MIRKIINTLSLRLIHTKFLSLLFYNIKYVFYLRNCYVTVYLCQCFDNTKMEGNLIKIKVMKTDILDIINSHTDTFKSYYVINK